MTLTARQVEAVKPQEKPYKIADSGGLYLYAAPTGLRSWRTNYQQDGKQKTRTYGRYPDMTLAQSRIAHGSAQGGTIASNGRSAVCPTFETVAKAWLKVKLPGLSNPRHQGQVANTLERFVYPKIGGKPIDTIWRTELVEVVQIAQQGGRIETAHRVAGRTGSTRGIQAAHASKLGRILALLDVAKGAQAMNIPGFKLHPLNGSLAEHWSVWVNGNWRVTFRFTEAGVELVDYQDYH